MTTPDMLTRRARRVIPGGVNSPVRAFRAVDAPPIYVTAAHGSRITTSDGRSLTDFCGSWGPLILGHAHPSVVEAVIQAARRGMTFGITTEAEIELAEQICRMAPGIERVRLVSSGTEAVMTALRLARGFTGRRRLMKFGGCYHGHCDSMLVCAGSGLLTGGQGSSAGVTPETAADVFVVPFNDLAAVNAVIRHSGDDLAAIIVEPIAANMGLVMPDPSFLEELRAATNHCGALLVFDEVITGFRFGPTTYGEIAGIRPDLTVLGKIAGGGMPLGAVGGRADIMDQLAPDGPVYQAGTLSGNPVAVAAGIATLKILERDNPYARIATLTGLLIDGLRDAAAATGMTDRMQEVHCASLFTVFFRAGQAPRTLDEVRQCDTATFAAFFRKMLARNVYLPPSQFETGFVSAAHSSEDITVFVEAATEALLEIRN